MIQILSAKDHSSKQLTAQDVRQQVNSAVEQRLQLDRLEMQRIRECPVYSKNLDKLDAEFEDGVRSLKRLITQEGVDYANASGPWKANIEGLDSGFKSPYKDGLVAASDWCTSMRERGFAAKEVWDGKYFSTVEVDRRV